MNVSFEEILLRDGVLVYKTSGKSMKPMLRQNRDLVTIRPPSSRLKKFDVALYRRGDDYILHRVIDVAEGHYLIRGDNTFTLENVPDGAVIGVLTDFVRKGKEHCVTERGYLTYVKIWNGIYPIRAFFAHLRGLAGRAARKLGIRRKRKNR